MLKSVLQSVAVASVLAISASSAQAVTVKYQSDNGPFNGNGKAEVWVDSKSAPDATVHALAGGFHLKGKIFGDLEENFVAWCLDIMHPLANKSEYSVTSVPFNGAKLSDVQTTNIGKLFNTAYRGINLKDDAESAGFQLALWEIIYEKPGLAFDLEKDNLTVSGKYALAAIAKGQAFLGNLNGKVTSSWSLTFLESGSKQDLVTATPVPVPAAAGLLLLALGGLAAVGRRRRVD